MVYLGHQLVLSEVLPDRNVSIEVLLRDKVR
jgi:hypothetical protein